ncbi:TPA: EbsA family protein [Streptococcus suis]|nr:EbsA family protein [Streptococcus suis]
MIKIFGKIRYHWQPDLSWAVIYWSLTFLPLFVSMTLLLEKLRVSRLFILLLSIFFVMVVLGSHRYFELKEKDLRIASANPFAVQNISISNITKVEVSYLAIRIFSTELPNGQVYHMRKWPKKYFINHLVVHSHFVGEIILVDHLIKQDYFEEYYAKKAKSF